MRTMRVYADTSVFGGCYDEKFRIASRQFFDEVARGRFCLIVSGVTAEELHDAPERVRAVLALVSPDKLEYHEITDEMEELQRAYLSAGVLSEASDADALHVAAATVLNVDMIVSWNFKHIVHFDRIRGFNAVNQMKGYKQIGIFSPMEVVEQ